MIIDTHAHVNFKDFADDYEEVIKRAHDNDVVMINVGSQISTSHRAVEIAQKFSKTFAAVGLHPVHLENFEIKEEAAKFKTRAENYNNLAYEELAKLDQVVAIGECGLDYFHINNAEDIINIKEKQKQILSMQIDLANEQNLPVIFHCRGSKENPDDAYKDLLSEIRKNLPQKRGVIHSFLSDWQMALQFIELGFSLGFNGIITFDKTGKTEEILVQIPQNFIVLETDCPYLTPEPFRGKRNEPSFVEYVAKKVAELRDESFEQVAEYTTRNAKTLFSLAV